MNLLNMSFVGHCGRPRAVRRWQRRGAVLPDNLSLPLCRGRPLARHERPQDRALFCPRAGSPPLALLLVQLAELVVGPELAEATILGITEQGRLQFSATLVAAPRQAQPLDQLAQDIRVARLPLDCPP